MNSPEKLYIYEVAITKVELVPPSNRNFTYTRHHTIKSINPLATNELSARVVDLELDLKVDQPDAYEYEYKILSYLYSYSVKHMLSTEVLL